VRLKALLLALLLGGWGAAPAALPAYGGSTQAGLDGTQPWDTVPQEEADLELWGRFGDGRPALGPGVKLGLLDWAQASGAWFKGLDGQADRAELGLQLREPTHPDWRPALALMARAPYDGAAWHPRGGLVAQLEPWDACVTLNATWGADGPWALQAGLWTPYVAEFVRLGLEGAWAPGGGSGWTPQLQINGPGDISLALGCRIDADGGGGQHWAFRLSYDLFPNP
jgi:hypothetical protein